MSDNDTTAPQERVFTERRRKPDWVTNMATVLSFVSWVVAFGVWIALDMASPEKVDMFTTQFNVNVRGWWDTSLLLVAFILLVTSFGICSMAFIFNMLRKRRKTDKYRKSILIIGAVTVLGIIAFWIRFGDLFIIG
jgi:Ni/Fe-hydrogenase subunit HybB-like protein